MEAQKHNFEIELGKVREKLHQVKLQSTTLESAIEFLKTQK